MLSHPIIVRPEPIEHLFGRGDRVQIGISSQTADCVRLTFSRSVSVSQLACSPSSSAKCMVGVHLNTFSVSILLYC